MNKAALAVALSLALVPLTAAYAGEGNGPDFPGLQVPDVGITTSSSPSGQTRSNVTMTEQHNFMDDEDAGLPSSRPPQYGGTQAQKNRAWAMLQSTEPNG